MNLFPLRRVPLFALGFLASIAAGFGKPEWAQIAPEELAATKPTVEADAPAELVLWRYEVDDRQFPYTQRSTEYRRYKIFVPDKADEALRVSRAVLAVDGFCVQDCELRARLTQPNGTVKEFGKEAVLTRTLSEHRGKVSGSNAFGSQIEHREKYLAVAGAEPGAVLEILIQSFEKDIDSTMQYLLQAERIPVRRLEFTLKGGDSDRFRHGFFLVNAPTAKFDEDEKNQVYYVSASNVPSLVVEPFSGVKSGYTLTALSCYMPYEMGRRTSGVGGYHEVDPKAGPWAPYASVVRWIEEDDSKPTRDVKKAAPEIIGGGTDLEKARRIHNFVRSRYQDFRKRSQNQRAVMERSTEEPSIDDALELREPVCPNLAASEFSYLALCLYRLAGLRAELVLLPDRDVAPFDPKMVAWALLSSECIGLQIDGKWYFSQPATSTPLPFGELDWSHQGQVGLVARANRQDFIEVPLGPPAQSVEAMLGAFRLSEDGTLSGDFRRVLTGQWAIAARGKLRDEDLSHQREILVKELGNDLKGAELTVSKISQLDAADQPLEIFYRLSWPGFAVAMGDRLIVRPSVFHGQATSPFTASSRRNPVQFSFRWQSTNRLAIQLPEGYAPESMSLPPSYPGEVLSYKVACSFDAKQRMLFLRREQQSAAITVPASAYGKLKEWYDAVASSDQHELVFRKSAESSATAAEKP